MVNSEQETVAQQKGVFRSNCMDCLDRTNVIQSLLARRSLQTQLQVTPLAAFRWSAKDQADHCSWRSSPLQEWIHWANGSGFIQSYSVSGSKTLAAWKE